LNNPGGIRSGLAYGDIVYGDLATATPFDNPLHSVELQGNVIREALEFSVSDEDNLGMLQVSGVKVIIDMKKPAFSRIVKLDLLCRICIDDIPRYEPVDDEKFYRVVMPSFLAGGGDDFSMIREGARNTIIGPKDIDAVSSYIKMNTPFNKPPLTGRIEFI
jgi:2',3'-cyclic-nucleotide 2'-phosphodiesterase (5'-nucleotidase family)